MQGGASGSAGWDAGGERRVAADPWLLRVPARQQGRDVFADCNRLRETGFEIKS